MTASDCLEMLALHKPDRGTLWRWRDDFNRTCTRADKQQAAQLGHAFKRFKHAFAGLHREFGERRTRIAARDDADA